MRKDGYYWVKIETYTQKGRENIWIICLFKYNEWSSAGHEQTWQDEDFIEINENRIPEPVEEQQKINQERSRNINVVELAWSIGYDAGHKNGELFGRKIQKRTE